MNRTHLKSIVVITIFAFSLCSCAHPGGVRMTDTGEVVIDRTQKERGTELSYTIQRNPNGDSIVITSFESIDVIEQKNKLIDIETRYYKYSVLNEIVELCAWAVVIPGVAGFFGPMISGKTLDGREDRLHATIYDSFSTINPFMNAFSCGGNIPYVKSKLESTHKNKTIPIGKPVRYEKRIPKGEVDFTAVFQGKKYTGTTDLSGDYPIKPHADIQQDDILEINGKKFKISISGS